MALSKQQIEAQLARYQQSHQQAANEAQTLVERLDYVRSQKQKLEGAIESHYELLRMLEESQPEGATAAPTPRQT
ncbi:MAG: hypothetical protein U0Z53_23770 [Blastocatellia bacterium]